MLALAAGWLWFRFSRRRRLGNNDIQLATLPSGQPNAGLSGPGQANPGLPGSGLPNPLLPDPDSPALDQPASGQPNADKGLTQAVQQQDQDSADEDQHRDGPNADKVPAHAAREQDIDDIDPAQEQQQHGEGAVMDEDQQQEGSEEDMAQGSRLTSRATSLARVATPTGFV